LSVISNNITSNPKYNVDVFINGDMTDTRSLKNKLNEKDTLYDGLVSFYKRTSTRN